MDKVTVELSEEQIAQVNKFIIDLSYYLPDSVRESAQWQNDSSEVMACLKVC